MPNLQSALGVAAFCGCFADNSGNVVSASPSYQRALDFGNDGTFIFPGGTATRLQLGINDDYYGNSGSYTVNVYVNGTLQWTGSVSGNAMPWNLTGGQNPSWMVGAAPVWGTGPVLPTLPTLHAGDIIRAQYVSGTVQYSTLPPLFSSSGLGVAPPTGDSTGASGGYFPTHYMHNIYASYSNVTVSTS